MISVIMPVYNEQKYIRAAIEAILNQDYKDVELIVVDDKSTDSTFSILSELSERDTRLIPIMNPEKGKVKAINLAFALSHGEWIIPQAGDDIMVNGILSKWYEAANHYNPMNEHVAVCSRIQEFAEESEYSRFNGVVLPKKKVATIMGINYMMSRSIAEEIFPLPEGYPNEDGWTRLCFRYRAYKTEYVDEICVMYRRHTDNSVSPNARFEEFNEYLHERKIVAKEFYDRNADSLNEKQKENLRAEIEIEEQRYAGRWMAVLFKNSASFSQKMRNLFHSNKWLYSIKVHFEGFFIGWAIQ